MLTKKGNETLSSYTKDGPVQSLNLTPWPILLFCFISTNTTTLALGTHFDFHLDF